jgi:hypothetical protein
METIRAGDDTANQGKWQAMQDKKSKRCRDWRCAAPAVES